MSAAPVFPPHPSYLPPTPTLLQPSKQLQPKCHLPKKAISDRQGKLGHSH